MRTHCITIDLANQGRRQVRARFDGGRMSSDGGALLLQAVDQRIGLTRRLAACFVDHRNPRRWPARAPSTGSSWAPPSRPRRTATSASWPTRSGAGGDRLGCGRDRRPAARPAGGAFLPRLLRLLLLPPAVCDLRATPAVRAAATVQPGRGGRGRGRVAADRGADPAALAAGAGGRRVLPRRVVGQAEWLPGGVRGDMENRIKEQQQDLFADRTSAATRRANQLQLYWALFAAASGRCVHPAPIRRAGRAECPGTGPG